jgi:ureidoacrylate peracid hydrolase
MHKISIPQRIVDRVVARRGKEHIYEDLDPTKTALIVIDLQNGFMMEGVAHSLCKTAIEIVPNVNRIAQSLRRTGGLVVWIKNTFTQESLASWSVMHSMCTKDRLEKRMAAMTEGSKGHQLWAGLDVQEDDLILQKTRFSAFIQGSSELENALRLRGIDTVVITGTVTNTCCESTARDAMMRNFKTIMVSDANAADSDEDHNSSLGAFYLTFGDVMPTDMLVGCLEKTAKARRAAAE